ncbi:hypothetical protein DYB32_003871 [Aphanomyces invadans]|uniref:PAC1-like LisH-like dimerisation domain-containing protein n=1 Tax=Aphanomyces invadans TaxID=157072 RepID=A0A418AZ71_9STRA|nr:hypothetical protein DYB32_003871 [Aphanomyces invadans]
MVLTGKQREDLHQAILEYLSGLGSTFAQSASAFQQDAGLMMTGESDTTKTGLLEKKWTSVVRLQRKVMELESKIQQLEEDAKLGGVVSRRDVIGIGHDASSFLPRAPPKHSMSGHRSPITCVVFHPVFSVVVTSSEDATIKVWDFETGEFERTLKGHTNAVQSVAFNPTGTLLGTAALFLTPLDIVLGTTALQRICSQETKDTRGMMVKVRTNVALDSSLKEAQQDIFDFKPFDVTTPILVT